MTFTTKLFTLGAIGAAVYGATRALRRHRQPIDINSKLDASDVHDVSDVEDQDDLVSEPIVVTEEVIVITEAGPYDVDLELFPARTRDEP